MLGGGFARPGGNIYIIFKKFWISNAHSNEKKIQNQTEIKPTQWQSPNSYIKYTVCLLYVKVGRKGCLNINMYRYMCIDSIYVCLKIWTFKAVFRISKIYI